MGQPSVQVAAPQLIRGVGLWAAIAVNVANMIGTGVFLKTRVMTCNVGSAKIVHAGVDRRGIAVARRHVLLFGNRGA